MKYNLICGDSLEQLRRLPDCSVNMCVTSPPYYGLRDYGTGIWIGGDPNCPHKRLNKHTNVHTGHAQDGLRGSVGDAIYKTVCPDCGAIREDNQIGLEETPEEYVNKLVEIFREVRRVLTDDGALWINIGDSYAGGAGRWGGVDNITDKQVSNNGSLSEITTTRKWKHDTIKTKDLMGIPWMLAFALRADGWYLRQDIIWHKPNPMPESVKDRCTKSHEYIFLLTKSPKYYFDYEAIQEPSVGNIGGVDKQCNRNKRDVWTVTPSHYKEAHFATYPQELILPCILATSRIGDTVLDPFSGSGTSGVVSILSDRNYIGIELNPEYNDMAKKRIEKECFFKLHCSLF